MRPPKIGFRFLFYIPKNIYLNLKNVDIFLYVTFLQNYRWFNWINLLIN